MQYIILLVCTYVVAIILMWPSPLTQDLWHCPNHCFSSLYHETRFRSHSDPMTPTPCWGGPRTALWQGSSVDPSPDPCDSWAGSQRAWWADACASSLPPEPWWLQPRPKPAAGTVELLWQRLWHHCWFWLQESCGSTELLLLWINWCVHTRWYTMYNITTSGIIIPQKL